jgi:hypothetical protein
LQTRIERLRVVYASRRQHSDPSDGNDAASAEASETLVGDEEEGEADESVDVEERD